MANKVFFNEKEHRYFLQNENGENIKELISVTTLLKKHGLSADYSKVNKNVLSAKAERGKIIHQELSNYILRHEIGFTIELQQFIDICSTEHFTPLKSEYIVFNDQIAGTIDFSGTHNGKTFLADFKTTLELHLLAVRWQLSLYEYLSGEQFDELLVFHFTNKRLEIVPIERIERAEIERLLECEKNGTIYEQKQELEIPQQKDLEIIQKALQNLEEQKKMLEEEQDKIKEQIMLAMETKNIKSFESDLFKITYVAQTTRETIDTKQLKAEMPEIANKYTKITNVNPSLRITLKEKKDE